MPTLAIIRAQQLAILGLLPLMASVLAGLLDWQYRTAFQWFCGYSALLLAFLGGLHWGLTIAGKHEQHSQRQLMLAILPFVAAAGALLLPPIAQLSVLAAAHLFWFFYERRVLDIDWYIEMRQRLAMVVVGLHIIWLFLR
ncbi:DUF3429 family protein [Idiomarina xiamenensis]|uniref:DUF3429 domain-containing protein n=1 Tax=Idiomarina xiamenensis 10-D-4 TaxID=740709 RepID=K2KN55_9GAMM|nr:DUF3429 family protein [Idiomarina xiamenensis]EKE83894.1 hypothetical protein A10D4_07101 [Idiomarina xiamenensis 10-D-4]